MTPLITTSLLVAALSVTTCSAPGKMKAYTNADRPLFAAINELSRHPHNLRAQEDLRVFYTEAVARHEKVIKFHSSGKGERRLYNLLHEMEALQHIYTSLQLVPLAFVIVQPKDYSKMIEIIQDAADYYATQNEELLQYQEAINQVENQ